MLNPNRIRPSSGTVGAQSITLRPARQSICSTSGRRGSRVRRRLPTRLPAVAVAVLLADPNSFRPARSPHARHPLTVPEPADTVHGLIAGLTGAAVVVVVNSFGCQIAIELALRHPAAVRRLVLTSPVVAPRARTLPAVMIRFIAAMWQEPVRYLGIVLVDAVRGWAPKGFAHLPALLAYPAEDRIRDLKSPRSWCAAAGTRSCLPPSPAGSHTWPQTGLRRGGGGARTDLLRHRRRSPASCSRTCPTPSDPG